LVYNVPVDLRYTGNKGLPWFRKWVRVASSLMTLQCKLPYNILDADISNPGDTPGEGCPKVFWRMLAHDMFLKRSWYSFCRHAVLEI